jgi:two-component system LytT family sensor kinase
VKLNLKEETKIAIGIVAFIYAIFTVVKIYFFFEQSLVWQIVTSVIGLFIIIFFGYIIRGIDIYLDKIYPFERSPLKRITIQFFVTLTVLFAIRLIPLVFFSDKLPVHASREIWVASFAINVFMVLSVILSIFGYHFFVRWKEEKILAAELEKEKALVQYDNLKNQLNPHFLFNALSALNSLIFENPQLASDFLQQLSKVYRYVLENKEKNAVSLQTEINFVSHYVKLLKTRFGDGLQVLFEMDEEAKEKMIVPVTLQILIENAVKHNTTSKDSPLVIRIKTEADCLSVENNLQKKDAIETSNKHGLENLKNLYRYISDKKVDVFESNNSFTVKIPLT